MSCQSFLSSVLRSKPELLAPVPAAWWVVWEVGAFTVPPRSSMSTMRLEDAPSPQPKQDPMCFLMGEANARVLVTLGRELDRDISLNDGTVSRQHLEFGGERSTWYVRVVQEARALLDGVAIPPSGVLLRSGQMLQVGGVQLRFHDTPSLVAWLTKK
jgi:hypothetical protein